MKLLVVDNAYILRDKNGNFYSELIYDNLFFQRYLKVFDTVRFVAKVKEYNGDTRNLLPINDVRVEICCLPAYQGMKGMITSLYKTIPIYKNAGKDCDCFLFRIAQIESFFAYVLNSFRKKPFAIEVVNDPETWDGTNIIFKLITCKIMKKMAKNANGSSYVTKEYLQKKYVSTATLKGESKEYFNSYYSTIDLNVNSICKPKVFKKINTLKIIHVSNAINSNIKGNKTVIEIVNKLNNDGFDCNVTFVGEGNMVEKYKDYVKFLKLEDKVFFIGRLAAKDDVLNIMKKSDLMIFPTHTEGLPRVIIEACAAGLPCLSTPVCGIPELISKAYLFEPEDINGFVNKTKELINNPNELTEMSIANLKVAQLFVSTVLEKRRTEFYLKLRSLAESRNHE
ncbi:MAG: glycosyltransferase [Malacoplasma sp.]